MTGKRSKCNVRSILTCSIKDNLDPRLQSDVVGGKVCDFSEVCLRNGPGPNKYVLPGLTGFDNHDPRKLRYPAYSVGFRVGRDVAVTGIPGPKYDPGQFIRTGNYAGPNAVVLPRRDPELKFNGIPGPVKYNPGPDPSFPNPPSAVVLTRKEPPGQGITPGPKYLVKGTVGRPVEDLPSVPAWSMLGRNIELDINRNSPGPRYGAVDPKLTKARRFPEATLTSRHEPPSGGTIPGPKYLGPYRVLKSQEPSWSFGVKHSEKESPLLTNEDRQPFYGF